MFRPHLLQGWSPDFISHLTEAAVAEQLVDEIVPVNGNEAMRLARELAIKEGIFVGTSSGATLAAALDVARRAPRGSQIVCMLPDTGERYLSTPLFEGISIDMNEDELALSRSTPGNRFDAAPAAVPVAARAAEPESVTDEDAGAFVSQVVDDNAVVMFALEWCEFCWAVRKLFAHLGVAYKSVDIDSVELQRQDMGTRIRGVLKARTGSPTIPQIWIGGTHVGGATDLFDALRSGLMQRLLGEAGVVVDRNCDIDPGQFLPKWLHPRQAA
jgi:cysteine synthase A